MQLFIRLKDGQPFEHPIFEDNFNAAFPDVDIDNLPLEFAKFIRIAPPTVGVYEVYEGVTYERNGDVFTDVHHVRAMTAEERAETQQKVRDAWAKYGFASWSFDENMCMYVPPTAKPNDDKLYRWDENTTSWIEVTL